MAVCLFVLTVTGKASFAQSRPPAAPGKASDRNLSEEGTGVAAKEKQAKRPLFQQQVRVRTLMGREQIESEFDNLARRTLLLLSIPFWTGNSTRLWMSAGGSFSAAVLLFGLLLVLLLRVRRYCRRYRDHMFFNRRPFLRLAFGLFRQTIPLFGITLFFYSKAIHLFMKALICHF